MQNKWRPAKADRRIGDNAESSDEEVDELNLDQVAEPESGNASLK